MLKKIWQELVAIRKELQAIRSDLEYIKEHPLNVVTEFPLPRSRKDGTGETDREYLPCRQAKQAESAVLNAKASETC